MKKLKEVKKTMGQMVGDKYHIDQIISREIHLLRYELTPSKMNAGDCLKFQYEIYEQLRDKNGLPMVDENGQPVFGWVTHITFTGSKTLAEDMADLNLSEAVQCQVIRQKCVGNNRFFYKLADVDESRTPAETPETVNNQ